MVISQTRQTELRMNHRKSRSLMVNQKLKAGGPFKPLLA
jgi:hypothetical protein